MVFIHGPRLAMLVSHDKIKRWSFGIYLLTGAMTLVFFQWGLQTPLHIRIANCVHRPSKEEPCEFLTLSKTEELIERYSKLQVKTAYAHANNEMRMLVEALKRYKARYYSDAK